MPEAPTANINIEYYLDLVVRRKWWIILPALISIACGVIYIKITPRVYKANTLILVQPQRIPTSYVEPTVTEGLESRLRTITQQVYSRTNIERIIDEFHLYKDKSEKKPTMTFVEGIRRKIDVNLRGGGRGDTQSFEISFEWHDPGIVAEVTNTLAGQFIEQNLKVREDMAMGTTAFLDSEAEKMRFRIEAQEKKIEAFKRKHMGMLPSQIESNLDMLDQLKNELSNLETRESAQKQEIVMLQRQSQMLEAMRAWSPGLIEIAPGEPGQIRTDEPDLNHLRARLQQLRLRYTEKHPDVVAVKRKIALVQNKMSDDLNAATEIEGEPEAEFEDSTGLQQNQIRFQLDDLHKNIESYQERIMAIKKEIQVYNEKIERIPEVELELAKLTRGYATTRERYQVLLQKKIDARMAEQLERRQKGEQFKVLDPAIIPQKPIKPDIKKALLMALIAGLGIGGGLAYLREMLDGTFYNARDIEYFLKTDVLVTIPLAGQALEAKGRGIRGIFSRS
jgi:polysaccharide chain length determinant protein (PEP-CTERM system associated)